MYAVRWYAETSAVEMDAEPLLEPILANAATSRSSTRAGTAL